MTEAEVRLVPRPTARVVLIDGRDRVLLFAGDESDTPACWFTPGGKVERGESHEEAALRELREETGLRHVTLGPEIWCGRPWTTQRHGVVLQVEQRYFLVRVSQCSIDTSGQEDDERLALARHHWWSAEELAMTSDIIRPAMLPELFKALLTAGPPEHPILVDG